jgi:hypothetical protein
LPARKRTVIIEQFDFREGCLAILSQREPVSHLVADIHEYNALSRSQRQNATLSQGRALQSDRARHNTIRAAGCSGIAQFFWQSLFRRSYSLDKTAAYGYKQAQRGAAEEP